MLKKAKGGINKPGKYSKWPEKIADTLQVKLSRIHTFPNTKFLLFFRIQSFRIYGTKTEMISYIGFVAACVSSNINPLASVICLMSPFEKKIWKLKYLTDQLYIQSWILSVSGLK
jgi:hypothetical protein